MAENLNIFNKLNTKIFITENHFMQQSKFIDSVNILMDYVYFKEINIQRDSKLNS